jgi:C_GCAxxG_C_C family probable redox protein
MNKPSLAREYMAVNDNCAQSIIKTFAKDVNVSEEDLIHSAFPFGGGFGQQGYICGALSGAAMILGAKYGKLLQGNEHYSDQMYAITKELFEQFRKSQGTILCKELLHFDLSKPDELLEAWQTGVFKTKCPEFVYHAAEILELLLHREIP